MVQSPTVLPLMPEGGIRGTGDLRADSGGWFLFGEREVAVAAAVAAAVVAWTESREGTGGGVSDAATTDGHGDGAPEAATARWAGRARRTAAGGRHGRRWWAQAACGAAGGGGGAGTGGAGGGGGAGTVARAAAGPAPAGPGRHAERCRRGVAVVLPRAAGAGARRIRATSRARRWRALEWVLIVYAQTIGFRPMVVATRVSASGAVLGRIALTKLDDVNASIGRVMVASSGSDYLVYANYTATVNDSPTPIHKFQIVDTAGAVRAESTTVFSGTPPDEARVYGGGANYLVLFATRLGPETTMLVSCSSPRSAPSPTRSPACRRSTSSPVPASTCSLPTTPPCASVTRPAQPWAASIVLALWQPGRHAGGFLRRQRRQLPVLGTRPRRRSARLRHPHPGQRRAAAGSRRRLQPALGRRAALPGLLPGRAERRPGGRRRLRHRRRRHDHRRVPVHALAVRARRRRR